MVPTQKIEPTKMNGRIWSMVSLMEVTQTLRLIAFILGAKLFSSQFMKPMNQVLSFAARAWHAARRGYGNAGKRARCYASPTSSSM
ncbi:hypothetical protein [uncultured Enorma sp.]|uniref:hypothetical protein n=1 Tax=uncultured Enorma sp. TaxID=1714346 RepID=UPI0025988B27|nr:hypothetical protein [uncultured Enorma sp.]